MALRTISSFKSELVGGGARSNLFEVRLDSLPTTIGTWSADNSKNLSFLCKAATLPASNIGSIDVPFRGRTLKVAGDRTVDPWTITIINDNNFSLRTIFENWVRQISNLSSGEGLTNPSSYMTSAQVGQLSRSASKAATPATSPTTGGAAANPPAATLDDNVIAVYKFIDIFPTSVSAIDVSYDSTDSIEEFTVEFQVLEWAYTGNKFETASSSDTKTPAPNTPNK